MPTGSSVFAQWLNPGLIDFHCHRPPQKSYRDDNPVLLANLDQQAIESCQGASLDLYALPDFQKGARFSQEPGRNSALNGCDLCVLNRSWSVCDPDKVKSPGNR